PPVPAPRSWRVASSSWSSWSLSWSPRTMRACRATRDQGPPVIVVISHPGDLHAERVIASLRARGREVLLLDLADLPHRATLSIDPSGATRATVRHMGTHAGGGRASPAATPTG